MENKCIECENENLLKVADLQIELDKIQKYAKLLENCLDSKEELNKVLRDDNEMLRNKLRNFRGEEWI